MCDMVLRNSEAILSVIERDERFGWLLKRFLVPCMKFISNPQLADVLLTCLDVFCVNCDLVYFLVTKGKTVFLHKQNP